ncbi:MAG: hypothetical protein DMD80_02050 [Candidatus Rokuibacteriota bacterium]|nr:MAG: hypothetical protein DMD80_02050 [Candidatus Rokubacteria bacterium]PYN25690.1 MAG: hypothetical protein DMD76_11680 [Candidatus Rokubacteria bacterium]
MTGLTTLGVFHTAIGVVALVCGFSALVRDKEISAKNRLGQVYLVTTLITAVTALGIFHHGGWGPGHVLAVLTLIALGIGTVAATSSFFGRLSRYVQAVSYSSTVLFHMIPAVTETSTRLPPGAPLVASQDAPVLQAVDLVLLLALLVGITLQVRWLRKVTTLPPPRTSPR